MKMEKYDLNDKELKNVTGGVQTPLGDYPAEDLIRMYMEDPSAAKQYLNLAKAFYPNLILEFKDECISKGLKIPDGMLD